MRLFATLVMAVALVIASLAAPKPVEALYGCAPGNLVVIVYEGDYANGKQRNFCNPHVVNLQTVKWNDGTQCGDFLGPHGINDCISSVYIARNGHVCSTPFVALHQHANFDGWQFLTVALNNADQDGFRGTLIKVRNENNGQTINANNQASSISFDCL